MPLVSPSPQALFTYGSLMCKDIMASVVGTPLRSTPAILPGYRCFCVRDEQYPGVIFAENEGSTVEGIIYHDITPHGWARLDRFEGEMYDRSAVTVRYDKGGEARVYCYVFRPQFQHRLTTTPWEYDDFLRNGKQLFQNQYGGFKAID